MTRPTTTTTMTGTTRRVGVRQYSPMTVLAIWAAAAAPMGVLAWLVVPALAGPDSGGRPFVVTLLGALTAGLVWQFRLFRHECGSVDPNILGAC